MERGRGGGIGGEHETGCWQGAEPKAERKNRGEKRGRVYLKDS